MKKKYYILTSEGNSQVQKAKDSDDEYMTIKEVRRHLKEECDRLIAFYETGNHSEDPDLIKFYDNLMLDWDSKGEDL